MKKRILIPIVILVVAILVIILYSATSKKDTTVVLTTEVQEGEFEILVVVTGELQAESSVEIRGPSELRSRSHRLRSIKIQDLVPEGTVVDSGEWVATLDRSEASNYLKDRLDELEKIESQFTKTKLDTTIQLRQLRDELINLGFAMEEKKIALEQSQYEPPATIRQAKIELDKASRAYNQAVKNYELKVQQAQADMKEVAINLAREQRSQTEINKLLNKFDIYAPAPGMVIYKKEWNGQKRTVGSEINPWDMTVATLPDLSTLISKTYVNEIDISRVEKNQEVRVGVDAFPEKKFTGIVTSVANIGEQLPNTDAKVFEVIIRLNEEDPILRPSMTTGNQILTRTFDQVKYIPLEAVHTSDSLSFVYTRKNKKQIVLLGEANENEIIVEKGLDAGEEVYLSLPENAENFKLTGEELIPEIFQRRKKRSDENLYGEKKEKKPEGKNQRPKKARPEKQMQKKVNTHE